MKSSNDILIEVDGRIDSLEDCLAEDCKKRTDIPFQMSLRGAIAQLKDLKDWIID